MFDRDLPRALLLARLIAAMIFCSYCITICAKRMNILLDISRGIEFTLDFIIIANKV